jgi:hypothetical protein
MKRVAFPHHRANTRRRKVKTAGTRSHDPVFD